MSLINEQIRGHLLAVAGRCPPGAFAEFGVYRGGLTVQLAALAAAQGRRLWAFDTFTGIPEQTPGLDPHKPGDFSDVDVAAVFRLLAGEVEFVVGDLRARLCSIETGPLAFAHVDVDQYESTRAALRYAAARMVPGGVIWLDDYECLPGATRAADEVLGSAIERNEDTGKFYARL